MTELKAGARIVIGSDAGTPGIADPGAQLAAQAIAAGLPVYALNHPHLKLPLHCYERGYAQYDLRD